MSIIVKFYAALLYLSHSVAISWEQKLPATGKSLPGHQYPNMHIHTYSKRHIYIQYKLD